MTHWQPVILTTDFLLWLIIAMLLFGWTKQRHSIGWQRLMHMPLAVAAGMVLLTYVSIALLDSLHFREQLPGATLQYSIDVRSVLDDLLQSLNTMREKTYSAPLSTHLFVKEQVMFPDGHVARIWPRLHLNHPDHPSAERRILYGILLGVLSSTVLGSLVHWRWQRYQPIDRQFPWRTAWITLTLLCIGVGIIAQVGGEFHLLGTDKIGQDVLYLSIKSIRTDLLFGALATLVTLPLAVVLGISAGYVGGWIDDAIQYIYTTLNAIPGILLIAAAVLLMQGYIENHTTHFNSIALRADFRLLSLCIILGMTSWTGLCRLLRGETLKLRELDYVHAARAFGVSSWRIMWRHVLPNLSHLILISLVMDFSGLVLTEAVLSYLGLGVDPAMASWGNMINAGQLELAREPVVWWPLASAFIFMFLLVLSANLLADSVREAYDPLGRRA